MDVKPGHIETCKRRFTQSDFDRFADLSRDDNPIHVDLGFAAQTRFGGTVAHGMILYSMICRVFSTQFPGPGTLQVQQELMFQYPTRADTPITVRCEVTDVDAQRHCVGMKTDIYLAEGKMACVGKALVLLPGGEKGFPGVDESFDGGRQESATALKRLRIGQTAEVKRTFTGADLDEYADLTGDTNPLFADSRYAKGAGFKDRIIPGPLLSGMFSQLLGTRLPGRGTNWLKQKLHFPAAACVGDEITAKVEIIRLRPEKDLVNLSGNCTDSTGERVCQAQSLVLVRDLEK